MTSYGPIRVPAGSDIRGSTLAAANYIRPNWRLVPAILEFSSPALAGLGVVSGFLGRRSAQREGGSRTLTSSLTICKLRAWPADFLTRRASRRSNL
jgi:hypothetical protein